MHRSNVKKWATSAVAAVWPHLFRWTHWPIVIRRRASRPRSVLLGRDMYLESRESPTTIWRLDPLVAAAISSGIMGQLIRQQSVERHAGLEAGVLTPGTPGQRASTKVLAGKGSHSF